MGGHGTRWNGDKAAVRSISGGGGRGFCDSAAQGDGQADGECGRQAQDNMPFHEG